MGVTGTCLGSSQICDWVSLQSERNHTGSLQRSTDRGEARSSPPSALGQYQCIGLASTFLGWKPIVMKLMKLAVLKFLH